MTNQPCRLAGCPGAYEARRIALVEYHEGEPFVVTDVPADVCDFCGDRLLDLTTAEQLERLRQHPPRPTESVPLYHFAAASGAVPSVHDQERASAD